MIIKLYTILLSFFAIGGIVTLRVNNSKSKEDKRKNWLKYVVYLVIVNALFISIILSPKAFHFSCIAILIFGFYELAKSSITANKTNIGLLALLIYLLIGYLFFNFSKLSQNFLFYTLFTTTVFDAFSQLIGQLFGTKKILPTISPNKTLQGVLGGVTVTLITSIFIRSLLNLTITEALAFGLAMALFAFTGDLLASYCKRKFEIKDYSNLIPGHGGFLDRFDSLLFTGSFIYISTLITQ